MWIGILGVMIVMTYWIATTRKEGTFFHWMRPTRNWLGYTFLGFLIAFICGLVLHGLGPEPGLEDEEEPVASETRSNIFGRC